MITVTCLQYYSLQRCLTPLTRPHAVCMVFSVNGAPGAVGSGNAGRGRAEIKAAIWQPRGFLGNVGGLHHSSPSHKLHSA